jgi:hypothetical protein
VPARGVHERLILNYDQIWKMRHRGRKFVLKKKKAPLKRNARGKKFYKELKTTTAKKTIKELRGACVCVACVRCRNVLLGLAMPFYHVTPLATCVHFHDRLHVQHGALGCVVYQCIEDTDKQACVRNFT